MHSQTLLTQTPNRQSVRVARNTKLSIFLAEGNPRQSWILDSTPWIPGSNWIGQFLLVAYKVASADSTYKQRISFISEFRIQESLT